MTPAILQSGTDDASKLDTSGLADDRLTIALLDGNALIRMAVNFVRVMRTVVPAVRVTVMLGAMLLARMPLNAQMLDIRLVNAVKQHNYVRVRALLAQGASPNALWRNPRALTAPVPIPEDARGSKRITGISPPSVLMISLGVLATDDPDAPIARRRKSTLLTNGASPTITRALLRAGADVNFRDADTGMTPLMIAARFEDAATVALMLRCGARVNDVDRIGATALIYAMVSKIDHSKTVAILLSHKADPNIRTRDGSVFLCYVLGPGRLNYVRMLIAHGADINARDKAGRTVLKRIIMSKNTFVPEDSDVARLLRSFGAQE